MLMENCTLSSLFGEGRFTTPVVEKSPPPTECIPFKIPLGIAEIIINDCYDGKVNPSIHLLKLTELCELFKILGLTRGEVMKKLFALLLKGKALEWYRPLDKILTYGIWKRSSLSFTPSFILFMKSMRIRIMFIISILMMERA